MSTRTRTIPLALMLTLGAFGCAATAVGDPPAPQGDEEVGHSTEQALTGALSIHDCTGGKPAMIKTAMNVGRFLAKTQEVKQCLLDHYQSCSKDDDKSAFDLVSVIKSANPTDITCEDQGFDPVDGGVLAETGQDDGYQFNGSENLDVDPVWVQVNANLWNAGDFFGGFRLAGTLYHEVMHTHGYSHGDNSDATDARDACDRNGTPNWFWRANTAPYGVEFCMVGAYTRKGAIGRSTKVMPLDKDDGDPGAAARTSIVDLYFSNAHKRLTDVKRTDVFTRIGNATLTEPSALQLEAAGNSLPAQATALAMGAAGVGDELFDPLDQDYFKFTLAKTDRVNVTITTSAGAAGIPTVLEITNVAGQKVNTPSVLTPLKSGYLQNGIQLQQDLYPGTYLVHVKGAPATNGLGIQVSVVSAPAPKAPTGCKGTAVCGDITVTCANQPDEFVLQHWVSTSPYYAFVGYYEDIDTDTYETRADLPSMYDPHGPPDPNGYGYGTNQQYRVCTKGWGSAEACSGLFYVTMPSVTCPPNYRVPPRVNTPIVILQPGPGPVLPGAVGVLQAP